MEWSLIPSHLPPYQRYFIGVARGEMKRAGLARYSRKAVSSAETTIYLAKTFPSDPDHATGITAKEMKRTRLVPLASSHV